MVKNLKAPTTTLLGITKIHVVIDCLAWIRVVDVGDTHYQLIKRRSIFVPKTDRYNPNPKPIYAYEEKKIGEYDYIGVGIGYYTRLKEKADNSAVFIEKDNRNFFNGCSKDIVVKLRPEQLLAIKNVYKEIVTKGQGLLDASTGIGKTVCSQVIRAKLGARAVLPFHKTGLFKVWIDSLKKFEPNAKYGMIGTMDIPSKKDPTKKTKKQVFTLTEDCDYCFITYQSLYSKGLEKRLLKNGWTLEKFKNHFSMQIFDEVHRTGAKEFSKGARFFNIAWKLSLSGTVDRKDGCIELIHFLVGETAYVVQTLATKNPVVYFVNTRFEFDLDRYPSIDKMPLMRYKSFLSKINSRNEFIAGKLIRALDAGRRVLIFAQNHVLINAMHDTAKRFVVNKYGNQKKVGIYTGKHSDEEKEFALDIADVSIVSIKDGNDSIDFKRYDTCFIIDPQIDIRQIVGRVCRGAQGTQDPMVLYFFDETKISNTMAWACKKKYLDGEKKWENKGLSSFTKKKREEMNNFKGRKIKSPTVILRKNSN